MFKFVGYSRLVYEIQGGLMMRYFEFYRLHSIKIQQIMFCCHSWQWLVTPVRVTNLTNLTSPHLTRLTSPHLIEFIIRPGPNGRSEDH